MVTSVSYKKIWNIAYPIILGSIAQNIINVTDTAFLGRVGQVALGAGAIGGIFYISVFMLGWGFGVGSQIIVARRFGEKKYDKIGETIDHSLYFLLLLALLIFILIKFLSPWLLKMTLNSTEVYNKSLDYLNVRIYGIFFAFIQVAFRAFYVGIGKTKIITWTTFTMAIVNTVLDYAFIFGKLGCPQMGIRGAAMASVMAEVSATILFIIYTLRKVSLKQYYLFCFAKFKIKLFNRVVSVSLPMMLQNFISLAGWFVFFLFVEKLGEQELAISNIIRSIYVVLMIPIWGFSSATNTLVSFLIGQKRIEEVVPLVYKITKLCAAGVLAFALLNLIGPRMVLRLYTNDFSLINYSLPVLYVVSGASVFIAVAFIFFNGVSGTGRTSIAFIIENLVIIVYLLACYLVTHVYKAPIAVVWSVEYLYSMLMGFISYLYLKYGKWKLSSQFI